MNRDQGKIPYQMTRIFLSPIFKMAYKPIIINKEYIPKDGPIILCGNHLHVWDQFPVICATKRTSHWMSKKEYFDSKLGPFFKATGAICVDRDGDASKATDTALEYLTMGSAVGIFPEGTRNGLKSKKIEELYNSIEKQQSYDEFKEIMRKQNPLASQIALLQELYDSKQISKSMYHDAIFDVNNKLQDMIENNIITQEQYDDALLLPFKYGAVSMAAKSGAQIVPFAVNGDYKIGNDNLIVSFGSPFHCNKDDLEKSNLKLRNKILTLEKQNFEYIKKNNNK